MARSKVLPARRPGDDESLLLRSAESLGRIIGSLQRQLDGVATRLPDLSEYAPDGVSEDGESDGARNTKRAAARTPARSGTRTTGGRRPSGASKVRSTADRKSKRTAKSAAVKKTAGRQSGARKAARKGTRGG